MPVWARIAAHLVPSDKLFKIVGGIAIGFIFFIILMIAAPIAAFKLIPFGKDKNQFQFYMDAVESVKIETTTEIQEGILVNWQQVMAIDAVLLEQNFDKSGKDRAIEMTKRFINEETEYIERTCEREVTKTDESGKKITEIEEYDCSDSYTVYSLKPFDDVLEGLVGEGLLSPDQIEDVKLYTAIDLTGIFREVKLPSNWVPTIGQFAWPVPDVYKVSSQFGLRDDPFTKRISMHNGLDIAADTGKDVVSIKDGEVVFANDRGTAGNAIIIKHDEHTESRYYHLDEILVSVGDEVDQGDLIGRVGSTGRTTGPHLHLEIIFNGTPVDPLSFYR